LLEVGENPTLCRNGNPTQFAAANWGTQILEIWVGKSDTAEPHPIFLQKIGWGVSSKALGFYAT